MQRFVPASPTKCTMKYEVYRNKTSSDEDFELINQMYKRIMTEDKALCANAQKNLNNGVFVNGELHPRMEKGPLYFQNAVRELLREHHKREEKEGREIWPARQTLPAKASTSKEDEDFCAKVVATSKERVTVGADSVIDGGCSAVAGQTECCSAGGGMGCASTGGTLVF